MFTVARETLRREIARIRNRDFLDAAMAASALVAAADGQVGLTELYARDAVLRNIEELNVFDSNKAVDTYRRYANEIESNPVDGRSRAMEAIGKLSGNDGAAKLLVRACIAIGKSDGDFDDSEVAVIEAIATILGVDPKDPDISDPDPDSV